MVFDQGQSIKDVIRAALISSVVSETLDRNAGMILLFAGKNLRNSERLCGDIAQEQLARAAICYGNVTVKMALPTPPL